MNESIENTKVSLILRDDLVKYRVRPGEQARMTSAGWEIVRGARRTARVPHRRVLCVMSDAGVQLFRRMTPEL